MNKSQWAEHLLRDEGFQMMMEELRSVEVSKFAMSAASEANVREDAYHQLRALEKILVLEEDQTLFHLLI